MRRFFGVGEWKRRRLRLRYESAAKKARLVMAAATTRVRAEADAAKEAAAAREAAATEEARAVATVATLVATGREALAKEIAMESVAREVAIEQAVPRRSPSTRSSRCARERAAFTCYPRSPPPPPALPDRYATLPSRTTTRS